MAGELPAAGSELMWRAGAVQPALKATRIITKFMFAVNFNIEKGAVVP
jgi:hypothetical protein